MSEPVSGNRRFLVDFKDRFEKDMNSNQITIMKVDGSTVEEEAEVPTIYTEPEETFDLDNRDRFHM